MNNNTNKKITIIGAGLTGSLLANFLAKRGFSIQLLESRPDMRKVEIPAGRSINLAISRRGLHALEKAGLMASIEPLMIPMLGRQIHDLDGKQTFQPYSFSSSKYINAISRADLNIALLDALGKHSHVNIEFNANIEQIDLDKRFLINNGQEQTFDHIIGADGLNSVLRTTMERSYNLKQNLNKMDHSYKELHFPTTSEAFSNDLRLDALHIWPRGNLMLIALPNMDKSFTVTLFLPTSIIDQLKSADDLATFFQNEFPSAIPYLPGLQQDFFENPTGGLTSVKCSPWFYKDTALLMGDSAHAIVPFYGQGMNCCFEDCRIFDELIQQKGASDFQGLFQDFYSSRKENCDAILELAEINYIEMRDLTGRPEFIAKKTIERHLDENYGERFTPVYSMVSFSDMEYKTALHSKRWQDEMLDKIRNSLEEIDLPITEALQTEQASHILESYLSEYQQ